VQLRRNGSSYKIAYSGDSYGVVVLTDLLKLSAGDYLEVWAVTPSVAGRVYGGSDNMTFSIMKVA
jgi:hypothetical protein